MKSNRPLLNRFILITGILSIAWTVMLHGQLYGYNALPRAGSTITLVFVSIITILSALIIENSGASKKPIYIKMNNVLSKDCWLMLAVLLPFFIFGLFFLLSSQSLRPLPAFIRQVSFPYLVFLLVLFLLWISKIIITLIRRDRTNALQNSRLEIKKTSLQRGLWNLFIFLALANALGSIIIAITQNETLYSSMSSRFLVEYEASIYTYVSGFLLLVISIGFGIQGYVEKIQRLRITWSFLSAIFLVLSIDEIISIHEELIAILRFTGFELTSSVFAYLLPIAAPATIIIYLVIRKFIQHRVQNWWLFLLGCSVFIFGAVFIESVEGALKIYYGDDFVPLLLLKSMLFIEEAMELIGTYLIIFFITGLFFGKNDKISFGWQQIPEKED